MALDTTLILVFAFFYVGIAFNHGGACGQHAKNCGFVPGIRRVRS
jgi:preprotein translocase subunit SecY